MAVRFADFATTWLSAPITAAATDLLVDDGGQFPALEVGDHFYVVLEAGVGREIVKVTGRVGHTFHVERAQDGTVARSFPAQALVDLRPLAIALEELGGASGRTDEEWQEFIRDTIGATLRGGAGITVSPVDDADHITITAAGGGSEPHPAAYLRRAGISMDSAISAAEIIAGTSSNSDVISLPVWASGNRYIGIWVEGTRAIATIEIVRLNRRAQFQSAPLVVDGVAGTLFSSRQPHTDVYSGQEAIVR